MGKYVFQKGDNYKIATVLMVILFFILLLLTQFASSQLFEPGYSSYAAMFIIGTLASLTLIIKAFRMHEIVALNAIDLSFVAFSLLLFLRWVGSDNSWIYSKAAITVALIPIYFFVKQFKSTYLIHLAIISTGIIQIVVSILQKTGYLLNTNASFEVGGTFGNPNILAMVLLLSIPSAFYFLYRPHSVLSKNLIICYALMALLVIVFTKCRTALLGSIFAGIFTFFRGNNLTINRLTRLLVVSIFVIILGGFVFLIFEKSESLFGRILIWQSCFEKIIEKPLWGFGISSFHEIYPEAQRLFLEINSNTTYLKLADSPQWAYNDFVELFLEAGIFTAMAFSGILISILYCWKTQKLFNFNRNNIAFLTVTIFFIMSTVNFAYTAWPVLLIFIINLAWSSRMCSNIIKFNAGQKFRFGLVLALIFLSGNIILGMEAGKNLQFQYELKKIGTCTLARQHEFYLNTKEKYRYYAPYIYGYTSLLRGENNQQKAIEILLQLKNQTPSFNTSYQLAETFLELYDLNKAKFYYQEASEFLPNRIMPHFQLFMIERTEKNFKKADSIKTWILCNEFKGDAKIISQIKETLIKYKLDLEPIIKNTSINN